MGNVKGRMASFAKGARRTLKAISEQGGLKAAAMTDEERAAIHTRTLEKIYGAMGIPIEEREAFQAQAWASGGSEAMAVAAALGIEPREFLPMVKQRAERRAPLPGLPMIGRA